MTFRRALGPFDATMVVIGGIIGAGIFITPAIVAQRLDTPILVLGAWAMGGAIALAGAFSYAELGASVIGAAPAAAAKGAVLIALGVPVYYWYARSKPHV